jgi:hypothetical protein
LQGVLKGLGTAASVFLTWALAREIDPDNDSAAFVGAGIILPGILYFGLPSFLAGLLILLSSRVLNRTVGPDPTIFDCGMIIGLAAYCIVAKHWLYGAMTAGVFLLDFILPRKNKKSLYFAVAAAVLTGFLIAAGASSAVQGSISLASGIGVLGSSFLFLLVIFTSNTLNSRSDDSNEELVPLRVQSAQVVTLVYGLLLVWLAGDAGVAQVLLLWAAVAGVALFRPFYLIKKALPK